MDTILKIELVVDETEREESFPVQEQILSSVNGEADLPASVIFAKRLAASGSGIAAPVFIP